MNSGMLCGHLGSLSPVLQVIKNSPFLSEKSYGVVLMYLTVNIPNNQRKKQLQMNKYHIVSSNKHSFQ